MHRSWGQNQPLSTVGAMSEMGKNNFAPQLWLDTLTNKDHLYGLGPYGPMQGEITIVDGKPFYASAYEEGKSVIGQTWDMKSPFFVSANVDKWVAYEFTDSISSVDDIEQLVAKTAKSKGYDTSIPFAFRIGGVFDQVANHIVTPRRAEVIGYRPNVNQQEFSFEHASGEIIGFYSENHHGVFTGSKSNIHVHFIKDDLTFMGHLYKIVTNKLPLTLYLPAKAGSSTPTLKVNDTDFSKGRLGNIQEVTLDDLVKFHGHLCDGLVVGFLGLKEALLQLYPDGTIDRTNLRIVSEPSPCLTDAAIYLTGGRYQFNTFYATVAIDGLYVVQRVDNGEAVQVNLNRGVKPVEIGQMGAKAVKGELTACQLDALKQLEDDFSEKRLSEHPKDNFTITNMSNFKWNPFLQNDFIKTDVINKETKPCKK
ncbi:MAG: acetolactate decarboxylase [Imperialibacter sp.]|uniref:acetolactate decarboxylase n=1 Tax=Imperialibacter sp. TaxID=2038411 RepID=UPI0032EB4F9B